MNLIKVLGIGSPFGDDQLGWKVAESLSIELSHSPIIIESHDRPGVRLLELMTGSKTVFLIDAIKSDDKIGTIHRFYNNEILTLESQLSTHHFGIAQALELGQALNALPDNIIFYGVTINSFVLEAVLSPRIKDAIEQVVFLLKNEIFQLLGSIDCYLQSD